MTVSKVKLSRDHVLEGLDQLRNEVLLCDVHLVAEGAKFPTHRVVLAAASPYFKAMFTGGFKENQMSEITLNDISSEGLKCVVDAIYTAELSLSEDNVCEIAALSNQLQLYEIFKHCGRFLTENVSTDNCLSFLSVAEKYDLEKAVDQCNKMVLENFDNISQSMEFTNLSKEQLCTYISDDHLKTTHGEIEVFRAALKWFEANRSANTGVLAELMQHVRFPLISSGLLLDEVQTNGLILENPEVMRMVREALRFHTAENLFLQPLKEGKQFQPRGELNLVVIQNVSRNTDSTVQVTKMHLLNATGDKPFHGQFSEQVIPRTLYHGSTSVVTEGNYLFIFGTDDEHIRPTAVRFDVKANTWLDLKPPPYDAVTYTAATLLKGKIYLLGGQHFTKDGKRPKYPTNFSTCASQYSIETNSWSKLQNLPKPLGFHSAASYENYVFCAGGMTGMDELNMNTLYAYDVVGKIWLSKAPMHYRRVNCSLEAVGAKLVARGDIFNPIVEIYDIVDDQWTIIQNGVLEHHAFLATVALNDKVYVIGGSVKGEDDTLTDTDYVSCVDVDNGTISRESSLPFPVANHVCTLLTVPNTINYDVKV